MPPRTDADAGRARGLLLAFVLVVSQASAWFHAVAISHVACLEHGEAMHGGVSPADTRSAARLTDETGVGADLATVAGHDHCANAALLRWRDAGLSAPAIAAPLLVAPGALPPAASPDLSRRVSIYEIAPKTSPPPASV
jgi:hypothetical protein